MSHERDLNFPGQRFNAVHELYLEDVAIRANGNSPGELMEVARKLADLLSGKQYPIDYLGGYYPEMNQWVKKTLGQK